MKKVAPNARSVDSERPLTIAAIECSRMPKCRFLPLGLPDWKLPAPSYVSVVLFDGARSADPPRNHGMFCASTLSTLPDASRPAMPLASAAKTGRLRSHPSGRSRRCIASISFASSGYVVRYDARSAVHWARAAAPRAPMPAAKCSRTPSGTRNCASSGHPELGFASRPSSSPRGAARGSAVGACSRARWLADVTVEDDQCGTSLGLAEDVERLLDAIEIVGIP